MRHSTRKLVALLATGALALAACSGDGDSGDAADTGDPALTMIGSGGCGGGQFGMSIDVRDADTGFTMVQLGAGIAADLSGGGTGRSVELTVGGIRTDTTLLD